MDPKTLPPNWPFRAEGRAISAGRHRWWVVETGAKAAPTLLGGAAMHQQILDFAIE